MGDDFLGGDMGAELQMLQELISELLAAAEFVVNDTAEPGEDARLTTEGYNRLCEAIAKVKGDA